MAMQLKIARSAKELDDVFWLRHQVYVVEDGKYPGESFPNHRIVDRFDAFPNCANIIAYDQQQPVGCLRISLDGGLGLPSEEYFDLTPYRAEMACQFKNQRGRETLDTCAGMLAVRKEWKRRRDVIRAMIKMAVGVWYSWGVTHVYATVNHDTVHMYDRLGFVPIAERQWIENIGNYVIPIVAPFESLFQWAFGYLQDDLLEAYSGHFERLLLKSGEVLFSEGEEGDYAYVVDEGSIKVSRLHPTGSKLTLATLGRGELFGELALIDTSCRSATATALKPTELIMLDRETFQKGLVSEPRLMQLVMGDFARRIRRMDDLAMVLAYGADAQRLSYALETLRRQAKPKGKEAAIDIVKMGPEDLANLAGVGKADAIAFLDARKSAGELDYKPRAIHFYREAMAPLA